MNFDSSLLHFLLVYLLSVCHLTQGSVGLHKKNTQKTFFLGLLTLCESISCGQILMNFDLGHFPFFLLVFLLSV
jgi:hypothetical protein